MSNDRKSSAEKTALVSGASRGIGRAIALKLAEAGYNLFLTARNVEALNESAELCRKAAAPQSVKVEIFSCDLSETDVARRIREAFEKSFNELYALINNAGIAIQDPIGSYTREQWDRIMNINAASPFFLMQEFIPLLEESNPGYIINIGSVVSKKGYVNQSVYSASKHALLGFTKSAARDLSDKGIRVHAVLPGGVNTELVRSVRPDINQDELIGPVEVADTVLFLLSMEGNAVVDEIAVRRRTKPAWD